MISKKLVLMASVFLFAGLASASFLNFYGVISGEVEVDPALEFEEVQAEPGENLTEYIVLENEASQPIDISRISVDGDQLSGESQDLKSDSYVLVVDEGAQVNSTDLGETEYIVANAGKTAGYYGIDEDDKINVSIDEIRIDEITYSTSCQPSEARVSETDCGDAKFEVLPGGSE